MALPAPLDIAEPGKETAVPVSTCHVSGHGVVVLISSL
jgi:hypothetical protein